MDPAQQLDLLTRLEGLWTQAIGIWVAGGWAMAPIAATSMLMFGMGTHIWLSLSRKGFNSVPERKWRRWVDHPDEREGKIGELLDFVTGGKTLRDTEIFFEELRASEITPYERDLRVMKICVTAAPLFGLLGTVTGMLSTFGALAGGGGGDQTMQQVAAGISEALITTETGLVIALPGLFFHAQLSRQLDMYKAFLAHLETVCNQKMYRAMRGEFSLSRVSVPKLSIALSPLQRLRKLIRFSSKSSTK